jgi:hypothetical protein
MMPEHLIYLRRAWEGHFGPGAAGAVRRVDLPTAWPADLPGPVRLSRAFNRPPLDPGRETLALRLGAVPGLLSVRLNGRPLATSGPAGSELPLSDPLPPRNVLLLELDPSAAATAGPGWGEVALVIRSKG